MANVDLRRILSLYLVMDLEAQQGKPALEIAEEAIRGGVTVIQLREKNASLTYVMEEGRKLRELCRTYKVPFIVNDRADVAYLLDADGLHVGQDDLPCSEARKLLGTDKIIGVSASSMDEASIGVSQGADYLGVGAIYATGTKKDAGDPVGTSLIASIRSVWDIPLVGIGGITEANGMEVLQAGADGIAVVSAIVNSPKPKEAAERLGKLLLR